MNISYHWLQKHIATPLPTPEALRETLIFHAFEVESMETVGTDTVFDIKVLPDRAHDCLSHYGIAREIAGVCNLALIPDTGALPTEVPPALPVEVQTPLCRRYIAVTLDDVTVGPSPAWLQDALAAVGVRSINNVVDATNYILLDRGQPVHVFDREKIDGGIVVRMAHEGEKITTLSKEEKVLQQSDMVIADYLGVLALAGVKGGSTAEVTSATTRIVVEIANFDPIAVRKTSRRLALITDASKRFENDFSPTVAPIAAAQVVGLIQSLAGGTVVGMTDVYPTPAAPVMISFSTAEITRLLGTSFSGDDVARVFDQYHYTYERAEDRFTLTVPAERLDIRGVHDIAEEVGRVIGYDRIPSLPLPFSLPKEEGVYERIASVKEWLAQNGFREVLTYTFRKKGDVFVSYGPKDKSALRTTLSEGLQESYQLNRVQAPLLGIDRVKLFEVGTVFLKDAEEIHAGTVDGGVFEELPLDRFIEKYVITLRESIPPVVSGTFAPWSVYPFIVRDVAVWVAHPEDVSRLDHIITTFAQQHCVRDPYIFDRFEKDGRVSVAYRLIFQSFEKTLTESEVQSVFETLLAAIAAEGIFALR